MASSLLVLLLAFGGDLDAAEAALEAGRPREALEKLGDLASGKTGAVHWRAYAVQGRAHLALREYQAAVEPLLRASDLVPDDRRLARDAAWACWGAASGPYASAYLADALRMARRAEDALLVADLHFAAGDWEQALAAYDEAEVPEGERVRVLQRRAECHERLGDAETARRTWADALEGALDAGDLPGAYRAAFRAERAGRFLSWLDQRIEAAPDDLDLRVHRGFARAAVLMYEEAVADLRRVVEARPDYVAAREVLADALVRQGRLRQQPERVAEGERMARAVLEEDPDNRRMWDLLSWLTGAYWTDRKIERYCDLTHFLHGIDPEDFNTALNFAGAARRLGRLEEARAALEGLLAVAPEDPDVLNDLAILKHAEGRFEEAVALWERALATEPDNPNALENLFTYAWERGDEERMRSLHARGLAAAREQGGPVWRWLWFRDRLRWAPSGWERGRAP